MLIEKFNNKYANLSNRQKSVLKEFINNISNPEYLKIYINENLDKIKNRDLVLQMRPIRGNVGGTVVPSYIVYVYAETYNILRIYGGRAGLLFAY